MTRFLVLKTYRVCSPWAGRKGLVDLAGRAGAGGGGAGAEAQPDLALEQDGRVVEDAQVPRTGGAPPDALVSEEGLQEQQLLQAARPQGHRIQLLFLLLRVYKSRTDIAASQGIGAACQITYGEPNRASEFISLDEHIPGDVIRIDRFGFGGRARPRHLAQVGGHTAEVVGEG